MDYGGRNLIEVGMNHKTVVCVTVKLMEIEDFCILPFEGNLHWKLFNAALTTSLFQPPVCIRHIYGAQHVSQSHTDLNLEVYRSGFIVVLVCIGLKVPQHGTV